MSADTGAREPQRLASLIAELRAVAEGEPTTMNQYEAADWLREIEEFVALAAGVGVPPDAERADPYLRSEIEDALKCLRAGAGVDHVAYHLEGALAVLDMEARRV